MNDELDQAVGRFPRHAPEVSRAKAEAVLFDELDKIALLFHQGGRQQREAMMAALEAIEGFLEVRGFSGQHIWPLRMLRKELDYLYEGNHSLILQPNADSRDDLPTRHAGPGKGEIRIYAAACSEALYQLGRQENRTGFEKLTRKAADEKIAQSMQKWPAYDQPYKVTYRTIKGWRDNYSADTLGNEETARYRFLTNQFVCDDVGRKYLKDVVRKGPPMTGGFRK